MHLILIQSVTRLVTEDGSQNLTEKKGLFITGAKLYTNTPWAHKKWEPREQQQREFPWQQPCVLLMAET